MRIVKSFALIIVLVPSMSFAAETATYSYDAKGRLVQVVKSGGPNSGATTTYSQDKADNRTRVTTSGAPN
jgi:hypothetical protein